MTRKAKYTKIPKADKSSEQTRLAAERALAETNQRRAKKAQTESAKEIGGASGPDPTRYGDWEKNGLISDF